jgi:T5SS/PEP-CTERM-associated repeat protein
VIIKRNSARQWTRSKRSKTNVDKIATLIECRLCTNTGIEFRLLNRLTATTIDKVSNEPGISFQFGQTGDQTEQYGVVTVTGAGSKMTAVNSIRVGKEWGGAAGTTIASTLTIEDGGLVMVPALLYGMTSTGKGYVRMGSGGILAILGTKTLSEMATVGSGSGAFEYNPSGDGTSWVTLNTTNATLGTDYTLTTYSEETFISGMDVNGYTVLTMAGGSTPAPFAITEIDYAPDADPNPTVTLTWRSRPNTLYRVMRSTDLSDWSNELVDSIGSEQDENTEDGAHITFSFDLVDEGLDSETDLYFRIEEQAQPQ